MVHRPSLRRMSAVTLTVALVLATVSTSNTHASTRASSAQSGKIMIGLITKTETNPFFVKMRQGATQAANAAGATLLSASGKFDTDNASQVTAIENMVTAGVKGILITPANTKAIVPTILKARAKGVLVIALDTPTDPQSATDALFATNNFKAGLLIGKYAKALEGNKAVTIATLDLLPGITVGDLRHNGFTTGFGIKNTDPRIVCSGDSEGDLTKGRTVMENCLQKNPNINLVYTINEPAAYGAWNALKAAGKQNSVTIVSVDGGCTGVRGVRDGKIAATSQQYPLLMASLGVAAVVKFAKTGVKPHGYTDTGVTLIAAKAVAGVPSQSVAYGLAHCWG
jgi:fructose transport system substrate-binding protein